MPTTFDTNLKVGPEPMTTTSPTGARTDDHTHRALNRAVHTIAVTRMRCCERTRAYVARRTAQGKSSREIRRCLKRYITRELYRALTTTMTTAMSPADA
jgi:hypothetical protein